ncbi:hypothetical protein DS745_07705 [Anaerobacillus alkaliphilus]|uniref:Uncharacterized protein n=1 Tax=Anaerobacillus alkaliphilus TaxID=1548597 RepID=A0A4Q0VX95_9BACI|nr:hypothetical protein [Anaerobacillus alkaliphilus]RXJ02265.1 hypothetical protein DS745_07705 [Anaerobacillus alkaliphilus]
MKKVYRNLLVTFCLVAAIGAVVFGSVKWKEKVELSGAEAAFALESEGIKVRTVDTTKFTNPDNKQTETNNETTNNDQSTSNSSTEVTTDKPLTSSTQPTTGTSAANSETQPTNNTTENNKNISEVKQEYMVKFLALEGQISAELDAILDAAIADVKAKQANNENVSMRDFQNKLIADVQKLESSSDQQFNRIYTELEVDLVANGFSKNEASPFRAQYQAEKRLREQRAVQKLAELTK